LTRIKPIPQDDSKLYEGSCDTDIVKKTMKPMDVNAEQIYTYAFFKEAKGKKNTKIIYIVSQIISQKKIM